MGKKTAIVVAAGSLLLAGVTAPAWAATPMPAPVAPQSRRPAQVAPPGLRPAQVVEASPRPAPAAEPSQVAEAIKAPDTDSPEVRRCMAAALAGQDLSSCAPEVRTQVKYLLDVKRGLVVRPAVPGTPHFTG